MATSKCRREWGIRNTTPHPRWASSAPSPRHCVISPHPHPSSWRFTVHAGRFPSVDVMFQRASLRDVSSRVPVPSLFCTLPLGASDAVLCSSPSPCGLLKRNLKKAPVARGGLLLHTVVRASFCRRRWVVSGRWLLRMLPLATRMSRLRGPLSRFSDRKAAARVALSPGAPWPHSTGGLAQFLGVLRWPVG